MQNKIHKIATHDGVFHTDEVVAIALLHLFSVIHLPDVEIIRSRSDEILKDADMLLDVGGLLSPKEGRFDHHQIENGTVSTAGLIWQWLQPKLSLRYTKLDKLIAQLDAHDCGVKPMREFSFASVISAYNTEHIYSKEQDVGFLDALNIALRYIENLKMREEKKAETKRLIALSPMTYFSENCKIKLLTLPHFCQGWQAFINGNSDYAHITHVTWFDKEKSQWILQLPAVDKNSFSLIFEPLQPDNKAIFVHQNGFLAVYK
ncbi:MYG1 family protein [Psychromonas hadalis]|uniref:MYG1 family protein n=1 Tax=Psychromonas hadalis TaxID=211669 RepID=UPI0003B6E117|nr:MYG1 family protein [Psychromonas hadalis]